MTSIKQNILYNVILTISTYLVNIMVFPYVTRVLGAQNYGLVAFANQSAAFAVLFAMLGIGIIGVREIAACGADSRKRDEIFSSLTVLSLLTTLVASLCYCVAIMCVEKMRDNSQLMLIGLLRVVFNTLLIDWFFRGIERFRYISLCTIVIKLVYILLVILMVKQPGDYTLYFLLTCLVIVANALVNIFYARKFVHFSLRRISLRPYLKPMVRVGSYSVLTSMYTTFNVIYLGVASSDAQVGYYYAATKIYMVLLGVYTAFSNVMYPRMSSIISQHREEDYRMNIRVSYEILLMFALPVIIFCLTMGRDIILVMSGEDFLDAVLPFRLIIPLLLVVGIGQVYVMQMLIPKSKDSILLRASAIGMATGIICNVIFVERFGAAGSALVLIASEIAVGGYYWLYVHRNRMGVASADIFLRQTLGALPYVALGTGCMLLPGTPLWRVIAAMSTFGLYFILLEAFIRRRSALRSLSELK